MHPPDAPTECRIAGCAFAAVWAKSSLVAVSYVWELAALIPSILGGLPMKSPTYNARWGVWVASCAAQLHVASLQSTAVQCSPSFEMG